MTKKEMQILITIIHLVSKRYQKDHDVQLICNALEKILVRAKEKKWALIIIIHIERIDVKNTEGQRRLTDRAEITDRVLIVQKQENIK